MKNVVDPLDMNKWQRAVYMRHKALERAVQDLSVVPVDFLRACASAEAFASYTSAPLEIEALGSRNTLFKHADSLFGDRIESAADSGRHYLESLRRAVHQQFKLAEPGTRGNSLTKEDRLKTELQSLKEILTMTQKSMLAQSTAYVKLLKEIAVLSNDGRSGELSQRRLLNLLNRHDEMFSDIFGPAAFDGVRPDNVRGI